MTNFQSLLETLKHGEVNFILVGGVAATAHGASRLTQDVDIVYQRSPENLEHLANALRDLNPYLRDAPPGLPFRWDAAMLKGGLNFTLTTTLGELDLLGEITGGGYYEDLIPYCITLNLFGSDYLCLNLERLIHVKLAAGRPKDLEAISELEAMHEARKRTDSDPA